MMQRLADFRADAVFERVLATGARTVLDLGCGAGDLLMRLVGAAQIERVTAVDFDRQAVRELERRLAEEAPNIVGAVAAIQASFCERDPRFPGHDVVVMAESIEHVSPERLSQVENAVFGFAQPKHVILTTPNREYNPMLKLRRGRMRHPDHKFEWDRRKFGAWCEGVAARHSCRLEIFGMGWTHPAFGAASQGAHFVFEAAA
ncbi:MAG: methyltransferase domain-containing protein [Terricaulis sp.]